MLLSLLPVAGGLVSQAIRTARPHFHCYTFASDFAAWPNEFATHCATLDFQDLIDWE
jgi:hypothetical protein